MCFPPSGMWPVSWFENHHHFFRCVSSSFAFLCFFFFSPFLCVGMGQKVGKTVYGALWLEERQAIGLMRWTCRCCDCCVAELWSLSFLRLSPLFFFGCLASFCPTFFFLFLFWCYFSSFVFFSVSGVSAYCDGLAEEKKKKCIFLKSEKKKKMMSTL